MNSDSGVLTRQMEWEYTPGEQKSGEDNLFHICVPAHLSYVGVARRAMDALGEQFDLSEDDRSALKLAVGEACNNAIQYGNAKVQDKIYLTCRSLFEEVEIDIVSVGKGFHPLPGEYAMPAAESMAESGRGLALIELMMDSVEYLTMNGKHIVRMRKRLMPRFQRHE